MLEMDKKSLIFEAIDAGHGDCLLVRFFDTESSVPRVLLFDGGPGSAKDAAGHAYRPFSDRLLPWLHAVRADLEKRDMLGARYGDPKVVLDLVVCTHIDDDHIAGIDQLYDHILDGKKTGAADIEANRLWFNSFSGMMAGVDIDKAAAAQPIVASQSVTQGERVTKNAQECGATLNEGSVGGLICGLHLWKDRFAPANLLVLNPDAKALKKLAADWAKEAKKKPKGGAQALGELKDRSVPNLSSIVIALSCFGSSILLTGDQLSENILVALDKQKYPSQEGVFSFDLVKVPHHGSIANVDQAFVDRVHSPVYVFSANGKDQNPDPPTLELFAKVAGAKRKFTMAFTNGSLIYDTNKKGEKPEICGVKVDTLDEALAVLCNKYPLFRQYVTIVKRDPSSQALGFALKKDTPAKVSGALA